MIRTLMVALLAGVLAGCAGAPGTEASRSSGTAFGAYPDGEVYRLSDAGAGLDLLVYRDGPMARLGHNHVMTHTTPRGYVIRTADQVGSRLLLCLPVEEFAVDLPDRRALAGEGFEVQPDDDAVAGTRSNMLGERVLNAGVYPTLVVDAVIEGEGDDGSLLARADVQAAGGRGELSLPVTATADGGSLVITSEFSFTQTELKLTPFSVMMGALSVRDEIDARLNLVATPAPDLSPLDLPSTGCE